MSKAWGLKRQPVTESHSAIIPTFNNVVLLLERGRPASTESNRVHRNLSNSGTVEGEPSHVRSKYEMNSCISEGKLLTMSGKRAVEMS